MPMLNIDWMDIKSDYPRLALTPGEPAGIGPDIVVKAVQKPINAELIAIADPALLEHRASILGLPIKLIEFDVQRPISPHQPGVLKICPVSMAATCTPGLIDPTNAEYVLESIKIACTGCLNGTFSALITAPINKASINQGGIAFTGHTEYLANVCGSGFPVMMLANDNLRIALVTTHIPLTDVSKVITPSRLESVLNVVWSDLRGHFGIKKPRILVCGINPHAGEGGYLGKEDTEVIMPVIKKLNNNGMNLTGPVPADTAFTPEKTNEYDIVICMYHDQGLPVIKSQGFGETVNITLGLPILRTSVDHGTALSLAGTGDANESSLLYAIKHAIKLSKNKVESHILDDASQSVHAS